MDKFTKGPWGMRMVPDSTVATIVGASDNHEEVATVYLSNEPRHAADLQLLLSAPALLEALEDMTNRFERLAIADGNDEEYVLAATKSARSEIAKARGS